MAELSQFLIVFYHEQGALHQDVAVFADAAEALRAYDAAERHFTEHEHIELVLIGSDSLDTVRRTHANYFDGTAALERLLAAG
jgi:predicted metal-dependent HD superfamily phosphohydrolase